MNNKDKVVNVKKTLVRNPEKLVSETIVGVQSKNSVPYRAKVNSASCSSKTTPNSAISKTRFNVPEMHSTLKISKKLDEVVRPRQTKSLSDVDKVKLAVDEKVSRRVNFPLCQPVFKDLIPLTNNEVKAKPVVPTRCPVYHKDKEPVLADFLQPRKQKVFYHEPKSNLRYLEETKMKTSHNGLQLFNLLCINEELSRCK